MYILYLLIVGKDWLLNILFSYCRNAKAFHSATSRFVYYLLEVKGYFLLTSPRKFIAISSVALYCTVEMQRPFILPQVSLFILKMRTFFGCQPPQHDSDQSPRLRHRSRRSLRVRRCKRLRPLRRNRLIQLKLVLLKCHLAFRIGLKFFSRI